MAHVPSRYTIREVLIVKRFICVCLFFLLILTAAFADDTPTLRIWGAYYDESIQSYASAGHNIDFRYSSFVDIAAAIASKNPDVDVFIFETYSGLDQIKKLNYYLPLPEDSTFQEHLNNLEPVFISDEAAQRHLQCGSLLPQLKLKFQTPLRDGEQHSSSQRCVRQSSATEVFPTHEA